MMHMQIKKNIYTNVSSSFVTSCVGVIIIIIDVSIASRAKNPAGPRTFSEPRAKKPGSRDPGPQKMSSGPQVPGSRIPSPGPRIPGFPGIPGIGPRDRFFAKNPVFPESQESQESALRRPFFGPGPSLSKAD